MKLYAVIAFMFIGMIMIDIAFDLPFLSDTFTETNTEAGYIYYKNFVNSFLPKYIITPFIGTAVLSILFEIIMERKLYSFLKLVSLSSAALYFELKVTPIQIKLSKTIFDPKSMEIVQMLKSIGVGHVILIGCLVLILLLTLITEKNENEKIKKN